MEKNSVIAGVFRYISLKRFNIELNKLNKLSYKYIYKCKIE